MITPLFHNFFPQGVITLVSDRTVDFTLRHENFELTRQQEGFLAQYLGHHLKSLVNIQQVHGEMVINFTRANVDTIGPFKQADGSITQEVNLPLAVRTADCLPIFIFDPVNQGIGLVHAGWRGSQKSISIKSVKIMEESWGACTDDLKVAFGPCIRICCYKVGAEFREYFPQEVILRKDDFFLDLAQVNKNQLISYGVKKQNICDCNICTCCDSQFFSFRREGPNVGRMISSIMLRETS